MEHMDKHMGQWGPQGLHNLLEPPRVARPQVSPHPHLGGERGHTDQPWGVLTCSVNSQHNLGLRQVAKKS